MITYGFCSKQLIQLILDYDSNPGYSVPIHASSQKHLRRDHVLHNKHRDNYIWANNRRAGKVN